jgi:Ca2+-binding RTX toxin-like protein
VFLREYTDNADGRPVSTGKLLGGMLPEGAPASQDPGMATWADTKAQAAGLLGLRLEDRDVLNVPMLAVDPYGRFIPGRDRGLPQYVTKGEDGKPHTADDVLVEGDTASPVPVPSDVITFETPFLTDIAHHADPSPQDHDHNPRTPPVPPQPDEDDTASADFADQQPGTYDDEMLDAHFIAGDGRVNENIGLTAIHQVFHSEHDRVADDIERVLGNDTTARGVAALKDWRSTGPSGWGYGERLFQAARFVTEMEYQHLVFEEFARKVQPAINPFEPFAFTQPDLNPAVRAEFAHAVYRFGHSMLTDTISRRNADGSDNDISLLEGFLNPPEYTDGGSAGRLSAADAAGSIIMGMSDQVGNELDEFTTETLRNNLLGLPLDLAAVNMARARSEGVPSLNDFRRQIFNATNDGQLQPYTSWVDFGENLKHPESLVNFVAAYGLHPTILSDAGADGELVNDPDTEADETADNGPATLRSRRVAARRLVNPVLGEAHIPADAADFMNSTGDWADDGVKSLTGLGNVDLWVGGLAETTNPFGGLLGTTFNYVFENQMTDLQNGDRLYYLARTPGMNLRTQLEGNSFAEMMMRNTTVHTLKADAFATADCKFELSNLAGTPAGYGQFGNAVADDPGSECDEKALLIRQPNGTIQYRAVNSVDPSGINGQAVYNGTNGVDRIRGGNDNDTFWGGLGKDVIEGGAGADVTLGGEGNDILTDLGGDDVPKGGPGNDAIDAGPGLDILMGGEGKDFTNGGANANETFGGAGDDFISLGQSLDAALGDSGDDWEEGGDQPDLMIGDSSNLFFLDDSQLPGSDILIGQGGDDDYDMEGGDDIGVGGSGIEKVAGASGFDWEIGQGEPQAQDMDLNLPIAPLDILTVGVRDRFNEVEALSGWKQDDTLRGDDIVPSEVGGGGFIGCDVLDQAGLDRISGLDPLIPALDSVEATPLADVVRQSASQDCPILSGENVWGAGNVLLGGAGSDLIEGRGANDIIDGDRYLGVRLSVRTNPDDPATEIGSASITGTGQSAMNSRYLRDSAGALTGPTLQQAVFAGTVDPGNIVAVREVLSGAGGTDTAVLSGVRANYGVVINADKSVTVTDNVGTDGVDTLRNIEKLRFTDETLDIATLPSAPVIGTATAGNGLATLNFTAGPPNGASRTTQYQVQALLDGEVVKTSTGVSAVATSTTVTGLTNGKTYTFRVIAVNMVGSSAPSAESNAVTPDTPGPRVTSSSPANGASDVSTGANATATFSRSLDPAFITSAVVRLRNNATGVNVAAAITYDDASRTITLNPNANLVAGRSYTLTLQGTGTAGIRDLAGSRLTTTAVTFTTAPDITAPVVTSSTPAEGATGVLVGANTVVNFSETVVGLQQEGNVVLRNVATGAAVPAVVTVNAAGTRVTVNPAAALARNTLFRLTLTGGKTALRDGFDNPLATTEITYRTVR